MGWLFDTVPGGLKAKLSELRRSREPKTDANGVTHSVTCLKSQFRGNVMFKGNFWTLWEQKHLDASGHAVRPTRRFVVCFMMQCYSGCWGWKDVDETMGPIDINCPLSYIEQCTEPENEYAKVWRERVRAYHARLSKEVKVGVVYQLRGCKVQTVRIVSLRPLKGLGEDGNLYRIPKRLLGDEVEGQMKVNFKLGQIVATPGAIEAMEESGQNASFFIGKHASGDWGIVSDGDKALNDEALKDDSRLLSAYNTLKGAKLWVITEADRSVTTVLLPEEY
jgi:hypothetical protein